jgi:archaellum biogenesis ATPase FlaH
MAEKLHSVRMPTGIPSLDPVLDGGVPPGSLILLLGEVGAGNMEFVYSSLLSLVSGEYREKAGTNVILPAGISYVTITRIKDDIIRDIALSFPSEHVPKIEQQVKFEDLSEMYFDASIVPPTWYDGEDLIGRLQRRKDREQESMLGDLVQCLGTCTQKGLIIIDSLTDVATANTGEGNWSSFIAFLRGLQRVVKRWNSNVYLLLTSGILEQHLETEITDCTDAVLRFKWEELGGQRRQRVMYFDKFQGVMPFLEERDLVRFAVKLSAANGFEVRNIRVVV